MSQLHRSSPDSSFWTDLRAVFKGTPRDFTSGSLGRAIVLLAIPMVLEMLMQSVFGVVDIYFVGRLGADAVAAVGMTDSLLVLVFAVGMGLSMAATAVVARRIGEKDDEAAGVTAFQVLLLGALVSVPIALLGFFFAPQMLALMGASPGVLEAGSSYCAILFGTNIVILFLFLINAVFRGAGDAVLAMQALWLANLLNIALDPILIFGWGPVPAMGVTGAAVATSIGRGVGVVFQLYVLFSKRGRIQFNRDHFRIEHDVIRRILKVSTPGVFQYLIGTASWLALFRLLAVFGSDVLAGYTIAIRILVFALLPSWGMGNAAATLVGQNLGAGQPGRAERSVWITSFANACFLGLVSIGMILYPEALIGPFTSDPAVLSYGVECLRIVSYTYVFFAFGMVTVQAFNGAGDTKTPTWINFVALWLFQLPLAYALAHLLEMEAAGIFAAIAIAQAVFALISIVTFKQGHWKLQTV